MECPVCYNKLVDNVVSIVTWCGHIYCKPCVDEILDTKASPACPQCTRPLRKDEIHRIFLPNIPRDDSQGAEGGAFQNEILLTRVDDLEMEKANTTAQMKGMVAKLDQLLLNFSKIDAENATIIKENKSLKDELKDIKMMITTMKTRKSTEAVDEINAHLGVFEIM